MAWIYDFDNDPGLVVAVYERSVGWPLYSFWDRSRFDTRQPEAARHTSRGSIDIPDALNDYGYRVSDDAVPYLPLWPGFAINTIFYAAILGLLFFAPGGVRRMIRRKRGLCAACAYPVGTSPVCTECGKSGTLRRSEGM